VGSRRVGLPRPVRSARRLSHVAEIAFGDYGARADELLLDTHVWVGLLAPDVFELPKAVLRRLLAVQEGGGLRVPDVAVGEIALKAGRGSLSLVGSARHWVDRALAAPGTRSVAFSSEMMIRTGELGSGAPADPFDRAMIATAQVVGIPLVTADRRITAWAQKSGGVRVVGVR
jgi:PIN domain nuclease of toxin-antitoxin system